jgi:class 3 adenylate cyclase
VTAPGETWQEILANLGVLVEPLGPRDVRLSTLDCTRDALLLEMPSVLTPSRAAALPAGPGLVVAPRASRTAVAEAARSHWGVITAAGDVDLRGLGLPVVISQEPAPHAATSRRGPLPWGSLVAVRRLLAALEPVTQSRLSKMTNLSQPQVHRALAPLVRAELVTRETAGFRVTDLSGAIQWWLAHYPGPRGVRSYWTGLSSPVTQAEHLIARLQGDDAGTSTTHRPAEHTALGRAALSGDAAADLIAPWRRPVQALVYAERPRSLKSFGLVPAASANSATLVLVSPQDPGVWLPQPWPGVPLPVADPLQVLYDLRQAPGADSAEAADQWRKALISRREAWSAASGFLV